MYIVKKSIEKATQLNFAAKGFINYFRKELIVSPYLYLHQNTVLY